MKGPLSAAAVLLVVLCLAAGIALSTRQLVGFNPHSDEGYYLRYASHVAEAGPAAIRRLCEEYVRDSAVSRHFPYPTRVLSILAGALAVRVLGPGFQSLAWASLAAFLFLLAVMFLGARRWFGERTALWAGLLCATAPLHLLLARRAIVDTMVSAAVMSCCWLVGWALGVGEQQSRLRRWWVVAAGFTTAFLFKESTLVLAPVALALIAWKSWRGRRFVGWWPAACVSVIPACAAGAVVVAAAGGAGVLREVLLVARQAGASDFAAVFLKGPWFRYPVDLLLVSPWPALVFAGWLGVAVSGQVRDERALFWALVPVLFIACALLYSLRDVRYIMPVEMPMRLGAALFLRRVFREEATPALRVGMAGAAAALMAADLSAFGRLARADLLEPVTLLLLEANGFLPFIPPR